LDVNRESFVGKEIAFIVEIVSNQWLLLSNFMNFMKTHDYRKDKSAIKCAEKTVSNELHENAKAIKIDKVVFLDNLTVITEV
jgi:hypothetical protein